MLKPTRVEVSFIHCITNFCFHSVDGMFIFPRVSLNVACFKEPGKMHCVILIGIKTTGEQKKMLRTTHTGALRTHCERFCLILFQLKSCKMTSVTFCVISTISMKRMKNSTLINDIKYKGSKADLAIYLISRSGYNSRIWKLHPYLMYLARDQIWAYNIYLDREKLPQMGDSSD